MLTFVASVAIMVAVVGSGLVWALREDRRRRERGEESHAGHHR